MKKIKLLIPIFLMVGQLLGQIESDSLAFPESWIGDWKGELEIFTTQGEVQSVSMQVKIHSTEEEGTFSWTLICIASSASASNTS